MKIKKGDIFKSEDNTHYIVEEVRVKVLRNNKWVSGVGFKNVAEYKDNYLYVLPVNEFLNKFKKVKRTKQQSDFKISEFPAIIDNELLFFPY